MEKNKWIGGYQPTDKLDTSNPPRQTAHEDKGAEGFEAIFDNHFKSGMKDGHPNSFKEAYATLWQRVILPSASKYASNERNRAIPLIEKCEQTISKVGNVFALLRSADPSDLANLIDAVDIDFELISAMIKDELSKLRK